MSKNKIKEDCGLYKFFRITLGPLYRFYYHPKIKGRKNIPKEGPIIVVGNHIHIMDQCNPASATRRCLHYMAKKEYFDRQYKEGKFPWFFKSAGCIPVDRSKKDTEAVESAMDVLNKGFALGLFPEGTRNAVKESRAQELYDLYQKELNMDFKSFYEAIKHEKTSQVDYFEELMNNRLIKREEFINYLFIVDNYLKELVRKGRIREDDYYEHLFLPFKYGAVSLALKCNALIIPFVTTGHYKFRSKDLNVLIGEPFRVSADLEESNRRLRQVMINLYKMSIDSSTLQNPLQNDIK